MAKEEQVVTVSFEANVDLSSWQYKFVQFAAEEKVGKVTASTDDILGVLQNKPESGEAGSVAIGGISKVVAGEEIAYNDRLTSNGSGQAIVATNTIDTSDVDAETKIAGMCVEGASSTNVGSIDLSKAQLG